MKNTIKEFEFSIIKGGLMDHFLTFLKVIRTNENSTFRKIVFFISVTWIPLFALSAFEGLLWTGAVEMPFLKEFATHIRLLVAIPLLIAAEVIVDQRVKLSLSQFNRSGLLTEEAKVKFELAKRKADQMSESVLAESVILILVLANLILRAYTNTLELTTWVFPEIGDSATFSLAGYWAAFISFPLFQFLLLRWIWRWVIWQRLLGLISKAGLRIIPQHPDKSGGLGFLGESPLPFGIFTFTLSIVFSAMLAERVLFQEFKLEEHYPLIGVFILLCVLMNVVPLLTFISPMSKARIKGINDFHALVAHHHLDFEDKWIKNRVNQSEDILGSPDVSSAADISMVYEAVKSMTVFPFNIKTMVITVVMSLLPLLVVFALQMPVADILQMLIGILM